MVHDSVIFITGWQDNSDKLNSNVTFKMLVSVRITNILHYFLWCKLIKCNIHILSIIRHISFFHYQNINKLNIYKCNCSIDELLTTLELKINRTFSKQSKLLLILDPPTHTHTWCAALCANLFLFFVQLKCKQLVEVYW